MTFHGNDEELLNQLKVCVTSALKTYFKLNATYPNKIIVYRDGVGDGQIEYVKEVSFFTMLLHIERREVPWTKPFSLDFPDNDELSILHQMSP